MKKFQIRPAVIDDAEPIRRMQAQSWCDTYRNDDFGVTAEWLKEFTDAWLTPEALDESRKFLAPFFVDSKEYFYRVALDGEKVVGMIHVKTEENGNKRLWGLYLDKAVHGSGLAQEMMNLANEWIGDATVELEVVSYNERAKAFYYKNGFCEVPDSEFLFIDKIPAIKMIREAKQNGNG